MHSRNPEIIELSTILGRSQSSVAYKLVNFASLDPSLKARGIKGMSNVGKLDQEIWHEFYSNWDERFVESEKALARVRGSSIEKTDSLDYDFSIAGEEAERNVKVRVNQSVFRTIVLSNYENRCCITGLNHPELLIASHILPWSKDSKNRLNPRNGLSLNALHDRAFECGLITVSEDYTVKISRSILKHVEIKSVKQNFGVYENKSIILPRKFTPDPEFLKYHNQERFRP